MPRFLITWLLTAIAFMITAYIVPGFDVSGLVAGAIAAVILGLVNAVVRPLLVILTLPLTIVTLGLFLLVINAISLLIASALTPGLTVNGLVPAILGSIVLTLVTSVLNQLVGTNEN